MKPEQGKLTNQSEGLISDRQGSHAAAGTHADLLTLQRQVGNQVLDGLLNLREVGNPDLISELTDSHGQQLDAHTLTQTEKRSCANLSQVRIHMDAKAAEVADAVNAYAFTQGADIFFGKNQFRPETGPGADLIAHELSHVAEQTQGQAQPAVAGAAIQRKGLAKADLEKKYGITIAAGDEDWSAAELEDLSWALARLSKPEAELIKGYQFLRWEDRESRREVDATYNPEGEEEAGLHEPNEKEGRYKISMYDAAFPEENSTMPSEFKEKKPDGSQPIGRFHILHEVGHAMATADKRKAAQFYYQRSKPEYDELLEQYTESENAAKQKKLKPALDRKGKEVDALAARFETANERVLAEFAKLTKGKQPVTDLAKTNIKQAFAETFAIYKLNPQELARMNPRLAAWFEKQGYLFNGK